MIEFEIEQLPTRKLNASIKVIGIGGAGGNMVNCIMEAGGHGIDSVVINTDAQVLEHSKAKTKIQIGVKSTKGLGTGTDSDLGKRAAEEDLDKVMEALEGADVVFITAGMGGGTGSGATQIIARSLREKGILSIAVVTKPFLFEGKRRARIAEQAIQALAQEVDTLLVIPNQKLLETAGEDVSMIEGFAMINEVLSQSVRGISDIIVKPGHINVDFADVRTIMKDRGFAIMGTGTASGANRAKEAAIKAISSPLLENKSIAGAHGVLMNITGGKNLGLHEISQAASVVYEQVHEDANIIIGSVIDESYSEMISITIIATGFEKQEAQSVVAHPVVGAMAKNDIHIQPTVRVEQAAPYFYQQQQASLATDHQLGNRHVIERHSSDRNTAVDRADQIVVADKQIKKENLVEPKQEESAGATLIDMSDLDIPSFLRQEKQ